LVDSTVRQTVERTSEERFSAQSSVAGEALLQRVQAYYEATMPLMELLFTGCRHGEKQHEELWTSAIQRLADAWKNGSGYVNMIDLSRLPILLAMSAGALGAITGKRYANLAAVTIHPTTRWDEAEVRPVVRHLSTEVILNRDLLNSTKRFAQRQTPGSELVLEWLREVGGTAFISEEEFLGVFIRLEILLALLTIDAGGWASGTFAWRDSRLGPPPRHGKVAEIEAEAERAGAHWGPLVAGCFSGQPQRIENAFAQLRAIAGQVAGGR